MKNSRIFYSYLLITLPLLQSGCTINIKSDQENPHPLVSDAEAIPLTPAAELDTDLTEVDGKIRKKGKLQFDSNLNPDLFIHDALPVSQAPDASMEDEAVTSIEKNNETVSRSPASKREPHTAVKIVHYQVKSSDTLMKISFELFGDVTRWREIYADNKGKIPNPNSLTQGTELTVKVFDAVKVRKSGKPYDIKRGDTLAKISNWVYGSYQKWKLIWNHNRELIHNPHWIYAGFRLYYVPPKEAVERKMASIPQSTPAFHPPTVAPPSVPDGTPLVIPEKQKVEAK